MTKLSGSKKSKSVPLQACKVLRVFQEVKVPRSRDKGPTVWKKGREIELTREESLRRYLYRYNSLPDITTTISSITFTDE